MQVLTKTLIKESEENAVSSGVFSYRELMYNAGVKASKVICDITPITNKRIAVVCGNGNNGGDGFVIARRLYELGGDVAVTTPLGLPTTEDAKYYYNLLPAEIIKPEVQYNDYDIIIDAIFGIGLNRATSEEICSVFESINKASAIKISVDIPSGVECDSGTVFTKAVASDYTITFIALKPCFLLPDGSDYCGEVTVADIGVEPVGFEYSIIEKPLFKKRKHNSHKGNYGTALIVCGSYGMAGAAILATKAALRSGLGIAKCIIPETIYAPFTASVPEAVCVPVKQAVNSNTVSSDIDILHSIEGCKAILFGCGSGKSEDSEKILTELICNSEIPLVIDADGINLLSERIELLKKAKAPIIITPHPGEMARLCEKSVEEIERNRVKLAREVACEYGCTVVLKGANTIVAEQNGNISFNVTGNPGMAKGGSGDVLAGIMVSLIAQGFNTVNAAKAAVYIHGEAGDKAAKRKGERAMLPSDIIEEL